MMVISRSPVILPPNSTPGLPPVSPPSLVPGSPPVPAPGPVIGPTPNKPPNNPGTTPGTPPPPKPAPTAPAPVPGANDPRSNEPLSKELYVNRPGQVSPVAGRPAPAGMGVNGAKLVHGYMRSTPSSQDKATVPGSFYCFFLFNPIEIGISYGFDGSIIPTNTYAGGDIGTSTVGGTTTEKAQQQAATFQNQSFTFSIVFDRTYEVNHFMRQLAGTYNPGNDPAKQLTPGPSYSNATGAPSAGRDGVYWDVRALERLMGMYDSIQQNTDGKAQTDTPTLPALANPVDVYFGGIYPDQPDILSFRGFFSNFEVTYERFTQSMIPIHATVQISMGKLFRPDAEVDRISTPTAILVDVAGNVTLGNTGSRQGNPTSNPPNGFGR